MRAAASVVVVVGILAFSVVWFIFAIASDPTWWWFVPFYGTIKIFRESVWWGLFAVSPVVLFPLGGAIVGD